jgi:hypothetical protein
MKEKYIIVISFVCLLLLCYQIKTLREENTMLISQRIFDYANNKIVLTDEELKKYDFNKDGQVDKLDSLKLLREYYGYE